MDSIPSLQTDAAAASLALQFINTETRTTRRNLPRKTLLLQVPEIPASLHFGAETAVLVRDKTTTSHKAADVIAAVQNSPSSLHGGKPPPTHTIRVYGNAGITALWESNFQEMFAVF